MTRWDFPSYLTLVNGDPREEDRQLDALAEQRNREEMCAEHGHVIVKIPICGRCGTAFTEERQ